MKLIIDIDEDIITAIKENRIVPKQLYTLFDSIVNSIPLPKGHGRLIDVDNIQEIELEDSLTVLTHIKGDEVAWHIDAPTIIEADKE